jgi:hypothetical protein
MDASDVQYGDAFVIVDTPPAFAPSTSAVASANGDIIVIDVVTIAFDVASFNVVASVASGDVIVAARSVVVDVVSNVAPRESPVVLAISIAAAYCRLSLFYGPLV